MLGEEFEYIHLKFGGAPKIVVSLLGLYIERNIHMIQLIRSIKSTNTFNSICTQLFQGGQRQFNLLRPRQKKVSN